MVRLSLLRQPNLSHRCENRWFEQFISMLRQFTLNELSLYSVTSLRALRDLSLHYIAEYKLINAPIY